jgi:hypothetical protein
MVNESTRYDGEDVALYRVNDEATLIQQRFDGVHAAPVDHDGDTYLVVNLTDYDDPAETIDYFAEVQDTLAGYDAVDTEDVEQLGDNDISTEALPDDAYDAICETVGERGFAVESLVAPAQEPEAVESTSGEAERDTVMPAADQ